MNQNADPGRQKWPINQQRVRKICLLSRLTVPGWSFTLVLCEGLWWSCLALTGYPALLDSDAKKVLGKKSERLLTDNSPYMLLLATLSYMFPFHQCCGSIKFWYGSGSADPYLWLMDPASDPDADPDPGLETVNKKFFFSTFLKHKSERSHKTVESVFFLLFLFDDKRIRIRIRIND